MKIVKPCARNGWSFIIFLSTHQNYLPTWCSTSFHGLVLSKPIVQFFHSRLQATEKKAKESLQNPIQNQILIETTANITLINSTRVRRVDPAGMLQHTHPLMRIEMSSFHPHRDQLWNLHRSSGGLLYIWSHWVNESPGWWYLVLTSGSLMTWTLKVMGL